MAREILSKRNFFDFESPDSAISRFPMTLMKSMGSLLKRFYSKFWKTVCNPLLFNLRFHFSPHILSQHFLGLSNKIIRTATLQSWPGTSWFVFVVVLCHYQVLLKFKKNRFWSQWEWSFCLHSLEIKIKMFFSKFRCVTDTDVIARN
jgi:hypothetical protein